MKQAYIITIIVSLFLLISLLFIPRHNEEEPKQRGLPFSKQNKMVI